MLKEQYSTSLSQPMSPKTIKFPLGGISDSWKPWQRIMDFTPYRRRRRRVPESPTVTAQCHSRRRQRQTTAARVARLSDESPQPVGLCSGLLAPEQHQ